MQHGSLQLRDWQKRQKLNQREAAVKLGVHFTTFNQFLVGRRLPGRELAITIQERTGIPVCAWKPTKAGKAKKARSVLVQMKQCLQGANG